MWVLWGKRPFIHECHNLSDTTLTADFSRELNHCGAVGDRPQRPEKDHCARSSLAAVAGAPPCHNDFIEAKRPFTIRFFPNPLSSQKIRILL